MRKFLIRNADDHRRIGTNKDRVEITRGYNIRNIKSDKLQAAAIRINDKEL